MFSSSRHGVPGDSLLGLAKAHERESLPSLWSSVARWTIPAGGQEITWHAITNRHGPARGSGERAVVVPI